MSKKQDDRQSVGDRLAAGFIVLTQPGLDGEPRQLVWLKASAVEFIGQEIAGKGHNRTKVGCIAGEGGFWTVSETPEEVLAQLAEVERAVWLGSPVVRMTDEEDGEE